MFELISVTLKHAEDSKPLLLMYFLQHFEKIKDQAHLAPVVTEALSAAVLLASIATLDDAAKGR